MGWKYDGFLHAVDKHYDIISLFPRVKIVKHFIEDDAQTPHIALDGIGISDDDLRGHVDWGAYRGLSSWIMLGLFIYNHFSEAKVR